MFSKEGKMAKRGVSKPTAAVVGLGEYYSKLRPGLSKYFNCVTLLDSTPDVMDRLRPPERSVFRLCSGPEDLADHIKSVQVVLILTPSHLHVPYALEAIKARKAAIIEKPIAISAEGVESLYEAAARGAPVVLFRLLR
jgi:predicted dehydrogenase